jgi:hypothetical protein
MARAGRFSVTGLHNAMRHSERRMILAPLSRGAHKELVSSGSITAQICALVRAPGQHIMAFSMPAAQRSALAETAHSQARRLYTLTKAESARANRGQTALLRPNADSQV